MTLLQNKTRILSNDQRRLCDIRNCKMASSNRLDSFSHYSWVLFGVKSWHGPSFSNIFWPKTKNTNLPSVTHKVQSSTSGYEAISHLYLWIKHWEHRNKGPFILHFFIFMIKNEYALSQCILTLKYNRRQTQEEENERIKVHVCLPWPFRTRMTLTTICRIMVMNMTSHVTCQSPSRMRSAILHKYERNVTG